MAITRRGVAEVVYGDVNCGSERRRDGGGGHYEDDSGWKGGY